MKHLTDKQKKEIEMRLGWVPNKAMLLTLLKEVESGLSIADACNKYALPEIVILDDDQDAPPPDFPGQKRVIITGRHHKSHKNNES